jgi:hypothetical protein
VIPRLSMLPCHLVHILFDCTFSYI